MIRSFVFQLLLKGDSFQSATDSLGQFLHDEKEQLQLNPKEWTELSLLAVFCLEDRLSRENMNGAHEKGIISSLCPMNLTRRHP